MAADKEENLANRYIAMAAGSLAALIILLSFGLFGWECLDAERGIAALEAEREAVQSRMGTQAPTDATGEDDRQTYERNRLAIANDARSYHSLLHDSFVDRVWNRLLRFPHRINMRRYTAEIGNGDEPAALRGHTPTN